MEAVPATWQDDVKMHPYIISISNTFLNHLAILLTVPLLFLILFPFFL